MRLNLTVLAERLAHLGIEDASTGNPYDLSLRRASIWDGTSPLVQDVLPICTVDLVKDLPGSRTSLIIVGDGPCEPPKPCGYIRMVAGVTAVQVLEEVFSIFDELSDWDMRLQEASTLDNALRRMTAIASEQFGNDLSLYDAQGLMICHFRHPESIAFEEYPSLDMTYVDPEDIERLAQDDEWERVSTSRLPSVLHADPYPVDSLIANIFHENTVLARVSADATVRPITAADRTLIWHVSRRLRQAFQREGVVAIAPHVHKLFSELLDEGREFDSSHAHALEQLGWDRADTYDLFVIRPEEGAINRFAAPQFANAIQQFFSQSITFFDGSSLATVCNLTKGRGNDGSLGKAEAKFMGLLTQNRLVSGESGLFRDFAALGFQHRKASLALEHGVGSNLDTPIHHFEKTAVKILVSNASGDLPARAFCPDALRHLAEYDRLNDTELLETLQMYLRCGLNASTAARELLIHRATLYYRLRRIDEATGLDLEDHRTRLYLTLVFEMLPLKELKRM